MLAASGAQRDDMCGCTELEAEAAEREDGGGGEVKVPREADEATRPEKSEDDAEVGSAKRSRGGEGDER